MSESEWELAQKIVDRYCAVGEIRGTLADALTGAISDAIRGAKPRWQPIDSAPRDGTPIIAWVPAHGQGFGHTPAGAHRLLFSGGGWWHVGLGRMHDLGRDYQQPTHWMPEPEPPSHPVLGRAV